MARFLVLGGGFGGIAAARELRELVSDGDEVALVASSERFHMGFAKLWDLVGVRPLKDGSARLADLVDHGIDVVHARVLGIDPDRRAARTDHGELAGDGMVVALGASFDPAHTALLGPGARNLYDPSELPDMRAELARLEEGRLVVSVLGVPYVCPPAPFEAALLLDEWLRDHGRREGVDLVVSTPQAMTMPAAGPEASQFLADRLAEREVTLLTDHPVAALDPGRGTVRFASASVLHFDLLLAVPAAAPPPVVAGSPLAGQGGWIWPDRHTFRTGFDRVYAVGDCTAVATATGQLPRAGMIAEAGGLTAARNLAAEVSGGDGGSFDGRGHCYLELPGRLVAKIEGDFYAEPQPRLVLTPPTSETFAEKQAWERGRLSDWFA